MSKEIELNEQIELYLTDRLSEAERTQFESKLEQDPLVKEELKFQEGIVKSIQNQRRVQLKSRLDNIPVSGSAIGESTASGLKMAGSVLAIAAVGVGAYLYLNQPETEAIIETRTPPAIEEFVEPAEEAIAEQPQPVIQVVEEPSPAPAEQQLSKTAQNNAQPEQEPVNKTPAERVQPNLVDVPLDEEMAKVEEMTEIPDRPINEEGISEVPVMAVKKIRDGKHNFHYQYYNDKLFLYGDFQNIPYEILDLAGSESRKLYLHYQDDFYYILSDQTDIAPLEIIKDVQLVRELNQLRLSKNR